MVLGTRVVQEWTKQPPHLKACGGQMTRHSASVKIGVSSAMIPAAEAPLLLASRHDVRLSVLILGDPIYRHSKSS